MSYTNETTHYGIPKPLGTDLTVPMDYNDAADAIDQALFDASTNASEAVTAAANAVDAAADAVEEVGSLGTEVNNLKGRTSALETSDVIQNNKIDALENQGVTKFDSAGVADPYVNGLTYSVGDVVTYNGQRYKCITAVVAAEPFDADKWSAEDVETVLNQIKSDLNKGSVELTADGSKTNSQLFDALYALIDTSKVSKDSALYYGEHTIYHIIQNSPLIFSLATVDASNGETVAQITVVSSGSTIYIGRTGTRVDNSGNVPSNGYKIKLVY